MLKNYFKSIDKIFLFIILILVIEGLIAVSTASIPQAILSNKGDEMSLFQGFQFTKNQLMFTCVGMFIIWLISAKFVIPTFRQWSIFFYISSLILMILIMS